MKNLLRQVVVGTVVLVLLQLALTKIEKMDWIGGSGKQQAY